MRKLFFMLRGIVLTGTFALLTGTTLLAADWNPLSDTGQILCDPSPCPAEGERYYGQDAQYIGAQPSYTDGNDTVTDNNTGLMWLQNTADTNGDGSITSGVYPTGDVMTWQQAVDYCSSLDFAGHEDWWLPSKFELQSIVDYGREDAAIHPVFTAVTSYYWSATAYAGSITMAWSVYTCAHQQDKTVAYYIRCVRAVL